MNAKFNVLYNGNIAFDQAKKQLDDTYEDNFWKRLPIEPLEIKEEIILLPGQSQTKSTEKQGFDKSEEKAVKSIQKHSMVIGGFEKNDQIDESYFLLGKSRYFLQRFIPALEAFTFALEKYPSANLYNETRIWKAKTHVRLQNEDLAIETLKLVLKNEDLPDKTYEEAHTVLAMTYTQLDSLHLIIDHLKKSTAYFVDKDQGARNMFILGQIYREENKIDSSNMVFDNLSYLKKIPRKYKIHAILERAKNYSAADSTGVITHTLQELIEDRDNRDYLDELYYQSGLIAYKQDSIEDAYSFYKKSVQYNESKPYQKSLSYEKLGNLYFDDKYFEISETYYDSVLQISKNKDTRRLRRIIKKKESLKDIIYYENIIKVNDSILNLSAMTPDAQKVYFEDYISKLKIKDEEERKKKEIEERSTNFGNFDITDTQSGSKASVGKFYFYNIQSIGSGKQKFKRQYGNRQLADNWIISEKRSSTIATKSNNQKKEEIVLEDDAKYDVNLYLDQIPTSKTVLDSIAYQRSDAHFNLGVVYKEQFKEYELAANNFEKFLKNDPNETLILPAKYHLYKIYENFDIDLSNKYRGEVVNKYPDSRYAEIILNPRDVLVSKNNEESPEYIYKGIYLCYEEESYRYALHDVNKALENFKGVEIEPKFKLLKAFIIYKTEGEEIFIEKLNNVIIDFPNTEESKHAKEVLEKIKNKTVKNKTVK
ncbi:MAG: tetratricopeptide repeat protein, partial [Flavobacteriaceae bacterium]|nr:tetratricopeptide repeat protein [Flavobacteriaceae bacterium]